ncbi:MAG: lipocalin-like domain-containing protein [Bacteroidaceae bacterium]|nr:lipocalin-like domain-containing protein [Bacteroidaceae bacterium]
MKIILYTALFSICMLLFGCDIETAGDGTFDGNWQLRSIETLATGKQTDMSRSYIYWGIENTLLQVRDIDHDGYHDDIGLVIFFHLTHKNNHLQLREPYKVITKDKLELLEDATLLTPMGIANTAEDFLVETHTNNTLVLKSETVRLRFRKY